MDHRRWDPRSSFPWDFCHWDFLFQLLVFLLPRSLVSGHSMPSAMAVLDDFLPGSFLLPWPGLTPSLLGAALGSKPPGNSSHLPGARAKSQSEPPRISAR